MIKNVLLDWSGTLADDLSAVLKATNLIFAEYGRDPLTLEEFRLHFRLPFSGFYADLLPEATAEGCNIASLAVSNPPLQTTALHTFIFS